MIFIEAATIIYMSGQFSNPVLGFAFSILLWVVALFLNATQIDKKP